MKLAKWQIKYSMQYRTSSFTMFSLLSISMPLITSNP